MENIMIRKKAITVRQELDHDEVSLVIRATPAALYDLVTDIPRTPEISSNVVRAGWVGGATGPAVGARFKAYPAARRGRAPSNKPVVTVANPASEFAFNRTVPLAGPSNGATNSSRKTV
jgi:hypothetical protein